MHFQIFISTKLTFVALLLKRMDVKCQMNDLNWKNWLVVLGSRKLLIWNFQFHCFYHVFSDVPVKWSLEFVSVRKDLTKSLSMGCATFKLFLVEKYFLQMMHLTFECSYRANLDGLKFIISFVINSTCRYCSLALLII